jgi:hypothetical protein
MLSQLQSSKISHSMAPMSSEVRLAHGPFALVLNLSNTQVSSAYASPSSHLSTTNLSVLFQTHTKLRTRCPHKTCSGQLRPSHGIYYTSCAQFEAVSDADYRTLTAAIVLVSIPGYLMGVPDFYWLVFDKYHVFTIRQIPQIWRIATNFLITGPKLGMILDPYFVFTYASSLETNGARSSQPGDFFVYLVFVCCIIVVSLMLSYLSLSSLSFSTPRISARSASYGCDGSWKRGRSPLHCAALVIRITSKSACGV